MPDLPAVATVVRADRPVVVVGGANLDLKAQTGATPVARTSNPGRVFSSPGGVGRNIAEGLARLGTPVQLVAPIGTDPAGASVRLRTARAGVGMDHVVESTSTGIYLAVLDETGELVVAVSDMEATATLTPETLAFVPAMDPAVLVVDGNVPVATTRWLLEQAALVGLPVVLDPVSVAKAALTAPALGPDRPVLVVTPNVDEMASLVGAQVLDPDDLDGLVAQARSLQDRGVGAVWIRRGRGGSVLVTDGVLEIPAPDTDLVDVTGAGDAGTAGLVHGLHRGHDLEVAAELGQTVAALTVASPHTVRPDLAEAVAALTALHRSNDPARQEDPAP